MEQIPKPASVIAAERRVAIRYCKDMFTNIKQQFNLSDQDWETACTNAVDCLEQEDCFPIEYHIVKCCQKIAK